MPSKIYDKSGISKIEKLVPEDIAMLLGEPQILFFESREEYDALFARMVSHFAPRDLIDFVAVRDITDFQWEIRRLKCLHKAKIELEIPAAAARLMGKEIENHFKMENCFPETVITPVLRKAAKGEVKYRKIFDSIAASAGVTHVALTVTAYSMGLETINEIEDAISKKEIRRDRITRDLEQRKKMLAAMLPKQNEIASTIIEVAIDDEEHPAEKE